MISYNIANSSGSDIFIKLSLIPSGGGSSPVFRRGAPPLLTSVLAPEHLKFVPSILNDDGGVPENLILKLTPISAPSHSIDIVPEPLF